ncbi:glycosyltransferase [Flaviramulus sp. BrNp1-15]|uniref:glycosyltransferase n=1 Tax=Flaviramulus sp. BrNp1-15 TaxID=2916754 RepID=UPI001EE868CC|nr:glycosyltransferase [Flaviramulus sp. BrNp1-15]ULC60567.1 glycosyltransferase [Flaviramulus sp. BrNp1-15]
MSTRLSLIIPVYNADDFINDSMTSITKWAKDIDYSVEVILVNDGSSDNSKSKIENYIESHDSSLKILSYDRNKGKGYAVKKGMIMAKGEFKIFTDADIPYGLEIIDKILHYLDFKEFDVCIGNRKSIHSKYFMNVSFFRKITSNVFTVFVSRFVVTGINDTQCGLKGFRSNVANQLFPKLFINGFGFDVELLYLSYKDEFDIKRIPVFFEGNDNSTISLAKDSLSMLIDVMVLPFRYHFTNKYK